jgi:hypothetical protein
MGEMPSAARLIGLGHGGHGVSTAPGSILTEVGSFIVTGHR